MNLVSIEILFAGMKSFSNFSVICRDKIIIGVCNNIFLSFFVAWKGSGVEGSIITTWSK